VLGEVAGKQVADVVLIVDNQNVRRRLHSLS
jgi:hypothetical protein